MYEWPNSDEKRYTGILMEELRIENRLTWICIGDFNQIVSSQDNDGGVDVVLVE